MHNRLRRAVVLAIFLALPWLSAAAQTTGAADGKDPVVATVNGQEIRLSEVAEAQQGMPQQSRMMPPSVVFPALLERLIDFKLLAIEGRKANLQDDEAVRDRMARLEDQVIRSVFVNRFISEAVTDEALRARYDEFAENTPPREEVRARHILVEAEEEAKTIIERIDGGADFEEVAKETSTGPSADQGGDLGYFTRDQMVPEFAEAAFNLKPGEMTDAPVKTAFGWHVIRVDDRRSAAAPSYEEMRDQMASAMSEEVFSELLESLRDGATIERFELGATSSPDAPADSDAAAESGAPAESDAPAQ